ncbi:MAG: DUF1573 domain-containing protein [Flavobacteriales bacterium]|nr:DUF1573 domain-containing protein [Flavobacteriales bacterium]
MKNNIGTILGAAALAVSLGNSYFIYELSSSKKTKFEPPVANNTTTPLNDPNMLNPMQDPNVMPPTEVTPPAPSGPPTAIAFKKMEHDFGNIKQDTENPYSFEFTNTGKNPLIITDAKGSCGCTVPEYPKEPIPPGGKGNIKVVYSPGKQEGQQTKNVTITANTEPQQTVLTIKANVK